jgi:S1-C subfamily serine protease
MARTFRAAVAAVFSAFAMASCSSTHPSAPSGVNPATFADSTKRHIGDIALAIGNPLGLASSATEGGCCGADLALHHCC